MLEVEGKRENSGMIIVMMHSVMLLLGSLTHTTTFNSLHVCVRVECSSPVASQVIRTVQQLHDRQLQRERRERQVKVEGKN